MAIYKDSVPDGLTTKFIVKLAQNILIWAMHFQIIIIYFIALSNKYMSCLLQIT